MLIVSSDVVAKDHSLSLQPVCTHVACTVNRYNLSLPLQYSMRISAS